MRSWVNVATRPMAMLGLLALVGCGGERAPSASGDGAAVPPGQQTYTRYCFSCHAAGVAGAPKLGDIEAWAPLIAKGPDLLLASTIDGVPPSMPARGLCSDCSDAELAAAIDYMIERSSPAAGATNEP